VDHRFLGNRERHTQTRRQATLALGPLPAYDRIFGSGVERDVGVAIVKAQAEIHDEVVIFHLILDEGRGISRLAGIEFPVRIGVEELL